jgi:hypothetical protein
MKDIEQIKNGQPLGFGLGDLVHIVANPIAKTLDAVAGTQIEGCQSCAQRRADLNKMMPQLPFPLLFSKPKQVQK